LGTILNKNTDGACQLLDRPYSDVPIVLPLPIMTTTMTKTTATTTTTTTTT